MWNYEKRLQYPVRITQTNPRLAQVIISQFGGPDGELGASMRYLSQRYTMPYKEVTGILTDIGTEELAHLEIVCAIVHQLTRNLSPEEIEHSGFAPYYVDHTLALWPQSAEVVIYADKICVDEETVRLRSHIENTRQEIMGRNIRQRSSGV